MKKNIDPDAYKIADHVGLNTISYMNIVLSYSLETLNKNVVDTPNLKSIIMIWLRVSLFLTRRKPEIAISSLLAHVIPALGDKPITECTKLTFNGVFNNLLAERKINEAKRVFALCKQFMTWCENQGYIEANPLASITRKDIGGKTPEPQTRALSDAEIWCFWHGLDMWAFSEQVRWGLRLCLVSARRPDEVFKAKKSEFNLNSLLWHQGDRNKSQRDHTLPISSLMKTCIEKLLEASPNSEWLCPSTKQPNTVISKGAPAQSLRRMVRDYEHFGLDEFVPRDLRRTARTKLAELGVQNDVSRKIMNHALEGIDRVYDRYNYIEQMKSALELLSKNVEKLSIQIVTAIYFMDMRKEA
uniref:Prophage CP4-57 integrase n=1 Tax=Pectobacterium carotovorum TaxID=554 RepID=A0A0K0MNW4_PECCA|nr:site-specific integrase [Pectobacterium carotovorum]AKG47510.1 Prophage CP4-57 integrase [Pectobacterium carotovorum]